MNYIYVSDFFSNQILGGAEICGEVLLAGLAERGFRVASLDSSRLNAIDSTDLEKILDSSVFLIGNFSLLSERVKERLTSAGKYLLYVHDHPYLSSRNPADYEGSLVPKKLLINVEFLKGAKKVFLQSSFQESIFRNNIQTENLHNLSGNLWSQETLSLLRGLSTTPKNGKTAIVNSHIWHKNVAGAMRFCVLKGLEFELIQSSEYHDFLKKLSRFSSLCFLPLTPETFSRVTVEAKMLGLNAITNGNIGAIYEPWYGLFGLDLIDLMGSRRDEIVDTFGKTLLTCW